MIVILEESAPTLRKGDHRQFVVFLHRDQAQPIGLKKVSFGSPVTRNANALATGVDVSGGERPSGKGVQADLKSIATAW